MNRRAFLGGGVTALAGSGAFSSLEAHPNMTKDYPPLGEIMDVRGRPVHVWDKGAGPAIVLIHGASGNLRDFTFDLAPRLAKHARVLAFDRPGFGYSARAEEDGHRPAVQAAILREAMLARGVERAVIVGHSWGGAVAMAWALDAPETVSGIVSLAGATMPYGGLSPFYDFLAAPVTGHIMSNLASVLVGEERIGAILARIFNPQVPPAGYTDYIGAPLSLRPETLRANGADLAGLNDELEAMAPRYPGITAPTRLIHGDADVTVGIMIHSEPLAQLLPNATLTPLPGIGHMPHHAEPDLVAKEILELALSR